MAILFLLANSAICAPPVLQTGGNPGQVNKNYADQVKNLYIDNEYIETVPEDLDAEKKRKQQEDDALKKDVKRGEIIYNPKFRLKNMNFEGNTIYKDKQLRALGSYLIGKDIYLEDVIDFTVKLSRFYQKNGYLTTYAFVPTQEIKNGVVTIQVAESRVGKKIITGNLWARKYYLEHIATGGTHLTTGKVFNVKQLQGAVKTINREAYMSTSVAIEKDANENTIIELEMKDRFPISFDLGWDDFGRNYTGRQRFSPILGMDNLTGFGDKIYGGPIISHHTFAAIAGYEIPVSPYGTKLSFDYSYSHVRPKGPLTPLGLSGTSSFYTLKLTQPFINNAVTDLQAYTQFDWISSNTDLTSIGARLADYDLRVSRTGLYCMHDDVTGRWIGNAEASFGIDAGGASPNIHDGPQSAFQKYIASLARVQRLPLNMLAVARLNGQYSPQALYAAEQMYIGGQYSIRGYQPSELIGDWGVAGSAELRFPIPYLRKMLPEKWKHIDDKIKLVAFYDWGYIKEHNNLYNYPKNFLQATGFGSYLYLYEGISAQVGVGFPIGQIFFDQSRARMYFTINTELDRTFLKPKYHGKKTAQSKIPDASSLASAAPVVRKEKIRRGTGSGFVDNTKY